LDKIVKLQNTLEEIKNLSINNKDNQDTRKKRSNSFDDILPKKEPFDPKKGSGRRRRGKKDNDDKWKENLKYEIMVAARDCTSTNDLNIRLSKLNNNGTP
jgi:hypothetical protein